MAVIIPFPQYRRVNPQQDAPDVRVTFNKLERAFVTAVFSDAQRRKDFWDRLEPTNNKVIESYAAAILKSLGIAWEPDRTSRTQLRNRIKRGNAEHLRGESFPLILQGYAGDKIELDFTPRGTVKSGFLVKGNGVRRKLVVQETAIGDLLAKKIFQQSLQKPHATVEPKQPKNQPPLAQNFIDNIVKALWKAATANAVKRDPRYFRRHRATPGRKSSEQLIEEFFKPYRLAMKNVTSPKVLKKRISVEPKGSTWIVTIDDMKDASLRMVCDERGCSYARTTIDNFQRKPAQFEQWSTDNLKAGPIPPVAAAAQRTISRANKKSAPEA